MPARGSSNAIPAVVVGSAIENIDKKRSPASGAIRGLRLPRPDRPASLYMHRAGLLWECPRSRRPHRQPAVQQAVTTIQACQWKAASLPPNKFGIRPLWARGPSRSRIPTPAGKHTHGSSTSSTTTTAAKQNSKGGADRNGHTHQEPGRRWRCKPKGHHAQRTLRCPSHQEKQSTARRSARAHPQIPGCSLSQAHHHPSPPAYVPTRSCPRQSENLDAASCWHTARKTAGRRRLRHHPAPRRRTEGSAASSSTIRCCGAARRKTIVSSHCDAEEPSPALTPGAAVWLPPP